MSWYQLCLPLLGIVLAILAQVAYVNNILVELLLAVQLVLMTVLVILGNRYLRQQILIVSDRLTQQHTTVMGAIYRMSREVVNISGMVYRNDSEKSYDSEFKRTEKSVKKALEAMGSCAKVGGKLKSRAGRRKAGREVPYGVQGRRSNMQRSIVQNRVDTDNYVMMSPPVVSSVGRTQERELVVTRNTNIQERGGGPGNSGNIQSSAPKMEYDDQQEASLVRPEFIDTHDVAGKSSDKDEGSMQYVSGGVRKERSGVLGSRLDRDISVTEDAKQETGAARKIFKKMCLNCANLMTKAGSPIRSNICQACKPIDGKLLTRFVYISKFNNLIEFYCGCEKCVKFNGAGCKDNYCHLCTDPKFVRNNRNM